MEITRHYVERETNLFLESGGFINQLPDSPDQFPDESDDIMELLDYLDLIDSSN